LFETNIAVGFESVISPVGWFVLKKVNVKHVYGLKNTKIQNNIGDVMKFICKVCVTPCILTVYEDEKLKLLIDTPYSCPYKEPNWYWEVVEENETERGFC
jgi:hypothetical protein